MTLKFSYEVQQVDIYIYALIDMLNVIIQQ